MSGIVSIHLGEAGIQIGSSLWELLCLEHGVAPDGVPYAGYHRDELDEVFFSKYAGGKVVPRAVFADTDYTGIRNITTSTYRKIYSPDQLVKTYQGANKVFASPATSAKIVTTLLGRIRKQVEDCSKFQGFMLYHATGGGTGSGVGALLLERLADEYGKNPRFTVSVAYDRHKASTEAVNHVLALSSLSEFADTTLYVENGAIFNVLAKGYRAGKGMPRFPDVNHIIAQTIGNLTSAIRKPATGYPANQSLVDICLNLVPNRAWPFLVSSYAPIAQNGKQDEDSLTQAVYDSDSLFVNCHLDTAKYIASSLMFRGDIGMRAVNGALRKASRKISFADGASRGFKVGFVPTPPTRIPKGPFDKPPSKSCAMFSNSTAIIEPLLRSKEAFNSSASSFTKYDLTRDDFEKASADLDGVIEAYQAAVKGEEPASRY